jgi:hypothetical protein
VNAADLEELLSPIETTSDAEARFDGLQHRPQCAAIRRG